MNDYVTSSGDVAFAREKWDSVWKAYQYLHSTYDAQGVPQNFGIGHGWVEGGPLLPVKAEIYQSGVAAAALQALANLARLVGKGDTERQAAQEASTLEQLLNQAFWIAEKKRYAFALDQAGKPVDESTVLATVPMWFHLLREDQAQPMIRELAAPGHETDWGMRIISAQSLKYSGGGYHYGAVWPLFTGWASMGEYQYGRPHVGYQALMANALLTFQGALGYVTELLSGEFNAPFGRSSHHQVWSEAMVVTPVVRGLLGLEVSDGGRRLAFAPALPADWDRVGVRRVAVGAARVDLALERAAGRMTITASTAAGASPPALSVAPSLPLDARVRGVSVDGAEAPYRARPDGDVQRVEVDLPPSPAATRRVVFTYDEGTDVFARVELPAEGGRSEGLRILRSHAEAGALRLVLEGLAGRTYRLGLRTPRTVGSAPGVRVTASAAGGAELAVSFDGTPGEYVRREIAIPLT